MKKTQPNRSTKIIISVFSVLFLGIACGVGYWWWSQHRHDEAFAACINQVQQYQKVLKEGASLQETPSYAVTDSKPLEALSDVLTDMTEVQPSTVCSPYLDTDYLERVASQMHQRSQTISSAVEAVNAVIKNPEDYNLSDIVAAAESGDFSPIAGEYCQNSGVCFTLADDGMATLTTTFGAGDGSGTYQDVWSPFNAYGRPQTQLHSTSYDRASMDYAYTTGLGFSLSGPDSEYGCSLGTGPETCIDEPRSSITAYPSSATYYVKGAGSQIYTDRNAYYENSFCEVPSRESWPKDDRPFFMFYSNLIATGEGCLVNQATDSSVFYLTD